MITANIISLENVSYSYKPHAKHKIYALNDISLKMNNSEIIGLIGPNGAGKTTLIKIILGIIEPLKGVVKVFDEEADSLFIRSQTGYQPDLQFVSKKVSVKSYLSIQAKLKGSENIDKEISEVQKAFNLTSFLDMSLQSLSRGMRQKVELAKAFIGNPKLVILDEPTAYLDPPSIFELRDYILSKNKDGTSILFSSHNLTEVEKICHRVLLIDNSTLFGDYIGQKLNADFLEEVFRKRILERKENEE